jgi:hypothetical protein
MEVEMRRSAFPFPGSRSRGLLSWGLPVLAVLLLSLDACGSAGDIQPGVGAAGVKLGDERAAVEKVLGKPEMENTTGVRGNKVNKEITYLQYPSRGLDVLLEEGKARSIFLYHDGADDHRQYQGRTAGGLTLASNQKDVLTLLGNPSSRGMGKDADRWFQYNSGIEISFQSDGTLHHLVITRPR